MLDRESSHLGTPETPEVLSDEALMHELLEYQGKYLDSTVRRFLEVRKNMSQSYRVLSQDPAVTSIPEIPLVPETSQNPHQSQLGTPRLTTDQDKLFKAMIGNKAFEALWHAILVSIVSKHKDIFQNDILLSYWNSGIGSVQQTTQHIRENSVIIDAQKALNSFVIPSGTQKADLFLHSTRKFFSDMILLGRLVAYIEQESAMSHKS